MEAYRIAEQLADGVRVHQSIDELAPAAWNALAGRNPFLRHEFLAALETTGCVGAATGWQPLHLSLSDAGGTLIGAMPLYLKSHSYGEFVFDWAWADAWRRAGGEYYPKLVSAVPFSPVTGPRLLGAPAARERLSAAVVSLADRLDLSSAHCLFPTVAEARLLERSGWLTRTDCQFQWHDRGYRGFDDFLATFSSAKRKKVRRERRRVAEAGIGYEFIQGSQLDAYLLDAVFRFYCITYFERGRQPYLNRDFFANVARSMGDCMVVILARHQRAPIAAAICFQGGDTLYGRHWGCDHAFHSLHFETCYYQGIEYCLAHGLKRFEPGTQGEHKLSRGFEPTTTWSAHWIPDAGFRAALADYLARERRMIAEYGEDARRHLPFRVG